MSYRFEFRPYCRSFRQPLVTHHGIWRVREGIILRLSNALGSAFGEIAPLEWFGSESLESALSFCRQLPTEIETEVIGSIPSQLPACQFGLQSAWEMLDGLSPAAFQKRPGFTPCPSPPDLLLKFSRLLPTGVAALKTLRCTCGAATPSEQASHSTFKWKIGVAPICEELSVFEQLIEALPRGAKLRLDANGGLTEREACQWLEVSDAAKIEFLEQPLPPDRFAKMLKLSDLYKTPIALDESVATLEQAEQCYEQGWRGLFVIKAAIAGSPQKLREFCQRSDVDVVWSSVFETAVAQRFIQTRLVAAVPTQRAAGFGVNHWFADGLNEGNLEQLWQTLSPI